MSKNRNQGSFQPGQRAGTLSISGGSNLRPGLRPEDPTYQGGKVDEMPATVGAVEDAAPLLDIVDERAGEIPLPGTSRSQSYGIGQDRDIGEASRADRDTAFERGMNDPRDATDDEMLENFRMSVYQNQLPPLPKNDANWHYCWLTTTNPRDSIQSRLMIGYVLVRPEQLMGWDTAVLPTGQYAGYVGVQEMIAARLPTRLYEMYMTEAHHNAPLAEEGRLRSTLDAIREAKDGKTVPVYEEAGMAELGTKTRRPRFEDIHGPNISPRHNG